MAVSAMISASPNEKKSRSGKKDLPWPYSSSPLFVQLSRVEILDQSCLNVELEESPLLNLA